MKLTEPTPVLGLTSITLAIFPAMTKVPDGTCMPKGASIHSVAEQNPSRRPAEQAIVLCSLCAYIKRLYTTQDRARPALGDCACDKVSTALDNSRRAPATCPRQLWWELR